MSLITKVLGTSEDSFRIGVKGPRWARDDDGGLSARAFGGEVLTNVRGAAPVADDDLVTKSHLDTSLISAPLVGNTSGGITNGGLLVRVGSAMAHLAATAVAGWVMTSTGVAGVPAWAAPSTPGGPGTDTTAIHVDARGEIAGIDLDATPSGDDWLVTELPNDILTNKKARISINTLPLVGNTSALIARGGLLVRGATYIDSLAVGGVGEVLTSDGTDAAWAAAAGGLTYLTEDLETAVERVVTLTPVTANDGIAFVVGTGPFQVGPAADGTAVGGNARGKWAIDLQGRTRSAATQVASGASGVLIGGDQNTASGTRCVVIGGAISVATGQNAGVYSALGGTASGIQAVVVGGNTNTATVGANCGVVGGSNNDVTGVDAVIAGGTGGTASGAQSFVGGGDGNTASGPISAVVGGKTNEANDWYAVCVGGTVNVASGQSAAVIAGQQSIASGASSAVVAGKSGRATGTQSVAIGGWWAEASGVYAVALGGQSTLADHTTSVAWSGNVSVGGVNMGRSEAMRVHLDKRLTTATTGNLASISTELTFLVANTCYGITGKVVAWNETDGTMTTWLIDVDCYVTTLGAAGVQFIGSGSGLVAQNATDDATAITLTIGSTGDVINFTVDNVDGDDRRYSADLSIARASHGTA